MARRKNILARPSPEKAGMTCNDCKKAYGRCHPGHDGKPIFLRCERHPEHLKMCTEPACNDYHERTGPITETPTFGYSENRYTGRIAQKVVPLFRPGERDPWKTIQSKDIPPQGISWTGEPCQGNQ